MLAMKLNVLLDAQRLTQAKASKTQDLGNQEL
jgi:hypothetical protein